MKMDDILNIIKTLSYSQGFYGRLYSRILELRCNEEELYEELVDELESKNFRNTLDVIYYFEC
jgi:hypothetical protein